MEEPRENEIPINNIQNQIDDSSIQGTISEDKNFPTNQETEEMVLEEKEDYEKEESTRKKISHRKFLREVVVQQTSSIPNRSEGTVFSMLSSGKISLPKRKANVPLRFME